MSRLARALTAVAGLGVLLLPAVAPTASTADTQWPCKACSHVTHR